MKKYLLLITLLLACVLAVSCSCEDEEATGNDPATCEHYWDKGKVIEEATVSKTGKMSYTCVLCGSTREENTPKLSHDHYYNATLWNSDRMNHWHDCEAVEGCTVKGGKAPHQWDKGEIIVESTPTTTGTKRFTCTVCEYSKEESYRAVATVTEEEYEWASCADAFENVTYEVYFEGELSLLVEIADGKVLIGNKAVADSLENNYGKYKLSSILQGIRYADLSYDGETRAYFGDTGTSRYTIQFADGKAYSIVLQSIKNGEMVTEKLVFSKYGKTEINE